MPLITNGLRSRLAAWRIGLWVLLLLVGYAGVQYLRFHAYGRLALSLLLLAAIVGCLLRQVWAWHPLRGLLLLLIGWLSWSLAQLAGQWGRFDQARQALAQARSPALREQLAAMLQGAMRIFYLNLALEALLLLGVLGLFLSLGRPSVKAQFLSRKQSQAGRRLV